MSYVVLARKYRPQSFEDLVGQEHVATTIGNAIDQGRIAHAMLFTGVRGVGKTTSARLLAKCLNCLGKDGKATGPARTPCQVCAACTEIANGSDMDVQEIDGASYNGVDEVRRLQDGLNFRPARDRYKVYIVDEVHMLSNAAWNAFLKTLEEPPPHVKFIFATTEVHKVPVTILSRCQRHDFKMISATTITARLQAVMKLEKITASDDALSILAKEAAGSMRDAMSLLDQVIAFSGTALEASHVSDVLGVADRKALFALGEALIKGETAPLLSMIGSLADRGFDIAHLCRDLLEHMRALVLCKAGANPELPRLLDLPAAEIAELTTLGSAASLEDLSRLYQSFSSQYDTIVRSPAPRHALEMALVRLARRPPLLPLDELLRRLGELEKRLQGDGGGGGAPGGNKGGKPAPRAEGRIDTRSADARPADARMMDAATTRATDSRSDAMQPRASAQRDGTALALVPALPPELLEAPPVTEAHEHFRAIVDLVQQEHPALASVLSHGSPTEVTATSLVVAYPTDSFLGAQASEAESLEHLTRIARSYFNAQTRVLIDVSARASAKQPMSLAAINEPPCEDPRRQAARSQSPGGLGGHQGFRCATPKCPCSGRGPITCKFVVVSMSSCAKLRAFNAKSSRSRPTPRTRKSQQLPWATR
jgi:DNA polymerase III subunit gamma/tau